MRSFLAMSTFSGRTALLAFLAFCVLLVFPASASSTWTAQDEGTMQGIRAIMGTDTALIAAGNTGYMMRSVDEGQTWTLLSQSSNVWWHDVIVAADSDLLAVGEGGAYAFSQDDGVTWSSASLGVSSTLYDIDRASSSTGYIVGASGTTLYFANGGWHTGAPNVTESLYAVQDNGDGSAWVVGGAGRFLRATNNGISWTNYGRIGSDNLWGVYFADASTGWIVGENGTFKKTDDSGSSWSNVSVSGLSTQHLYDIQASGNRIAVAGDEIVLVSEDGGETWTVEDFSDEHLTFYTVYVRDASDLWVAGTNDDVFSSVYHYETVEDVAEEGDEATQGEEETPAEESEEETEDEAQPGNLIKLACEEDADVNDPCRAVYFYASDSKRHAFPNEKVFFTWFDDFDDVIEVSADFLSSLSLGPNVTYHPGTRMVKFQSVRTVYAVEAQGVLRSIASEQVAKDLYGSDWNQQIDDISDAFYGNYSFGESIESKDDYDVTEAEDSVQSLDDNF